MKASALFQYVKSLSVEELGQFKAALVGDPMGEDWLRIVQLMLEKDVFKISEFRRILKIGASRFALLLDEIDGVVFSTLASRNDAGKLYNALITANKLVFRMADDAAIEVMEWAFWEADRQERFDITLQLIELTKILVTPHTFSFLPKSELLGRQINLLAFQELEEKFRQMLSPACTTEKRREIFAEIEASPLMQGREQARSVRALAVYLKIRAACLLLTKESENALDAQKEFVALIEANEWLNIENDFFLIKETVQLSTILISSGKIDEANSLVFRLGNMQVQDARSDMEKLKQLYPFRVIVAMLTGNEELVEEAIASTLEVVKAQKGIATSQFITSNLYHCAYAYTAIDEHQKAFRILKMLGAYRENSQNYSEQLFPMVKILKMVNLLNLDEVVNIPKLIHTFRNHRKIESNDYFRLALGLLHRLSNKGKDDWKSIFEQFHLKAMSLKSMALVAPQFYHFDLEVWIKSRLECRPMTSYLRHQTTNSKASVQKKTG